MTGQDEKLEAERLEVRRRLGTPERGMLATPQSGATLHQLLAAVETMQLGVTITDESGVILYANPAQARMYGVDFPDEIIGEDVSIFCLPGYREVLTPKRLEEMKSWRRERANLRKDGSILPVLLLSDVIRGPDGKPMGVITTCEDLTEVKAAETERNHLQLQVRNSDSLENLGALTSGLARDLKNMLSVVLGNTGLFLEDLPLDGDAVRRGIVDVDATVHRMATLIDRLLAYSGQGLEGMLPLDLNDHLRGMLRLIEASVDRNVRFRYEFLDDLPLIKADPAQVQQVVRQLVANASEAFEGRRGEIGVRTETRYMDRTDLDECQVCGKTTPGGYVLLEVSDDGPGMAPEIACRIFDRFFSTRSPSRGLGLTAMAAIVQRHDGAIWLSTRPGEGTRFRLLFPVAQQTATSEVATPEAAMPEAAISKAVPSGAPSSVPQGVAPDRARLPAWLPVSFGKCCPRCGSGTLRIRSAWYVRPFRVFFRQHSSTRSCVDCLWEGFALHGK